ncbi:MAG: hypothetical protein VCC00_12450 [Deltaproteobacteria bacterium]
MAPFAPEARSGRELLDAAIVARGGGVAGLERRVRARVELGYRGDWTWTMEVRAPDYFRWEIDAAGARQSFLHEDGRVRGFLGTAELPVVAAQSRVIGPIALFLTTLDLDALARPEAAVLRRLAPAELVAHAAAGLGVEIAGAPVGFHLYFDERGLLFQADGPVASTVTAAGTLTVTRHDFRAYDGLLLPAREVFRIDGQDFVNAEIVRWRVFR